MTRRDLLFTSAAAVANGAPMPTQKLGLDFFSLRSQSWNAFELLDFAKKHGASSAHFSEPRFLRSLQPDHLKRVRERADDLGLALEVGFGSICPTSTRFAADEGSAQKQLLRMSAAARILGSPFVRCYLGSADDRKGGIPFEKHIENTIAVCKSVRDHEGRRGIKIAVENHAGDLQALQLKQLIEEAGKDYVGALLDPGNAAWTLEDPHHALEVLAPYALTTGIRDSRIWQDGNGINVMWVPMGKGNIDIDRWARRFGELRPDLPFSLEIIHTASPRKFAVRDPKFWDCYRDVPAWVYEGFAARARGGEPYQALEGGDPVERQRRDVAADMTYSRRLLGIG